MNGLLDYFSNPMTQFGLSLLGNSQDQDFGTSLQRSMQAMGQAQAMKQRASLLQMNQDKLKAEMQGRETLASKGAEEVYPGFTTTGLHGDPKDVPGQTWVNPDRKKENMALFNAYPEVAKKRLMDQYAPESYTLAPGSQLWKGTERIANNPPLGTTLMQNMAAAGYKPGTPGYVKAMRQSMAPAPKTPPKSVQEFEYARKNGYPGTFADYQNAKANQSSANYGLSPFYTIDKDGSTHAYQLNSQGGATEIPVPKGQTPARTLGSFDSGDSRVYVDPMTGKQRVTYPKNVPPGQTAEHKAEVAEATTQAQLETKARVNAQQDYEKRVEDIKGMRALVKSAHDHPGLKYAVGKSSILPIFRGTDAAGFEAYEQQIKGNVFLEAVQKLKGTGALSEIEGAKGEDAIARLNRAQKEEDYKAALLDLDEWLARQLEQAKRAALGKPQRFDWNSMK